MKLFIVLSVCLLFVNAVRSEEAEAKKPAADWIFGFPFIGDEEMAEIAKLDQEVAKLTPDEAELKEDFLFGLVHHAAQGVLGLAHGVLHLTRNLLGDEELNAKLDQMLVLKPEDFELVEVDGATEQEKKDFILGLLHHAVHGVLGAAHGVLHLAGAIFGDEKAASDCFVHHLHEHNHHHEHHHLHEHHHFHHYGGYGGHAFRFGYGSYGYGDSNKCDFLFGLIHHAVRGVLNVGHHALHLVGHILGDEEQATNKDDRWRIYGDQETNKDSHWGMYGDQETNKDFLFGLVHHAAHSVLGLAHGVVHLTRNLLGDEELNAKRDQMLVVKPDGNPHWNMYGDQETNKNDGWGDQETKKDDGWGDQETNKNDGWGDQETKKDDGWGDQETKKDM